MEFARRLDERAAAEVMGWVRGGPDNDYWVLADPQPGHASVIRMTEVGWRPTTDAFCLELLVRVLVERGLLVRISETVESARPVWRCEIGSDPGAGEDFLLVTAPTRGLAVVCASLAYMRGRCGAPGEAL
jgi:hypothetical protein